MSNTDIANLIPQSYRKEILDLKMIDTAQAVHSDESMHYLFTVWENYVEPGLAMDCGLCISRVLNNFKQLKPVFIELERKKQLLDAIN